MVHSSNILIHFPILPGTSYLTDIVWWSGTIASKYLKRLEFFFFLRELCLDGDMRHQEIWVFILNLIFICHEIPIPRNIALLVNFYHGYHAWWCLQRAGTNMSQTSFHISKPFGTCSPWQPHTALTLASCMVCVSALHWPAQFLIKVKAELKIVSLHKRAH